MPVSSSRIVFLPARSSPAGIGIAIRSGVSLSRLDITIQVIDALAVDRDVGPELAVADALGIVRVAVLADDLDDVEHEKARAVGNGGQLECPFEQAPFGLGRVETAAVVEISSPRWWAAGSMTSRRPCPCTTSLRSELARDRQHAGVGRGQGDGLVGDGSERPFGEIEVLGIVARRGPPLDPHQQPLDRCARGRQRRK